MLAHKHVFNLLGISLEIGGAQALLLFLCPGIIPGESWGTTVLLGIEPESSSCKALPTLLVLQPFSLFFTSSLLFKEFLLFQNCVYLTVFKQSTVMDRWPLPFFL